LVSLFSFLQQPCRTVEAIAMARKDKTPIEEDPAVWLSTSLATVSDAVLGVDAQGHVLFLNTVAEALLACTIATSQGRPAAEIMRLTHESTGKALANPLLEALRLLAPVQTAPYSCLRSASGREILIEGTAAPVRSSRGRLLGSVLVFRDLAPRRRLEEGQRQAQKSDVLGQLRGGIAHDFNNLMTVIIGFSEMLLTKIRKATAPPEFEDPLTEIKSAAEKAALLTQQILALGRSQLLQMAIVDLNDLVASMEKTLGRLLGERIRVTTRLAADLPLVFVDSVQIQQVLLHLTVNAREALPAGGEVSIATRRLEKNVEGNDSQPELLAELCVSDTGVGMDAETLARAVEPFFTTKEGAKGMGLPVVEAILRQCGGTIRLESEPGRGSRAIVTLPASAMQPSPVPASTAEPTSPAPWEAILLVEDADRVRRLLARVLEEAGYTVFQAADGRAGLELCRQHDGEIQLLITDVIMPEMSGPDLVKSLTSMKQQPRVLFLSGYTADELERQGINQANYHFLHKPFLGDALLKKVRQVLTQDSGQKPESRKESKK
jgi:two-component system, cell cycle sensor histidine kinase and response regulator CckA